MNYNDVKEADYEEEAQRYIQQPKQVSQNRTETK